MSCARRILLPAGILAARLLAGQDAVLPAPKPTAPTDDAAQLPPDEDAALNAPKEYGFNPVQSKRELSAGMVYFRKGNYKAASYRFQEATKWNDGNAEAWLRLGESEEKRENGASAKAAYQHYLEIASDAKNAADVKKKLLRLK